MENLEKLLVDKKEACIVLGGICERTLNKLVAAGELKPTKVGRRCMFSTKTLAAFARRGTSAKY